MSSSEPAPSSLITERTILEPYTSIYEFDQYAKQYLEALDHPFRKLVTSNRRNYFIELKVQEISAALSALNLIPEQLSVLDVGCGIGLFERYLASQFKQLLAVDLSPESLRVGQQLHPLNSPDQYVHADALTLPFANNSIDVIFTSCMFHHMPHALLHDMISEMKRICRQGGYLVVFEHNPFNPLTQFVVKTTPIDKNARLISAAQLRRAFESNQVEIIQQRFILYGPHWLDNWLRKYAPFLHQIPFGGQYALIGKCT